MRGSSATISTRCIWPKWLPRGDKSKQCVQAVFSTALSLTALSLTALSFNSAACMAGSDDIAA